MIRLSSYCSIVVSILACHTGEQSSVPGNGEYMNFVAFLFILFSCFCDPSFH